MINPTGKKFLFVCDKVFEIQSVNLSYCEPLWNYVNGAPVEVTKKHTQKVEISGENDLKISFTATTEELEASPTIRRLLGMRPLTVTLGFKSLNKKGGEHIYLDTCLDVNQHKILHVVSKKNKTADPSPTVLWNGPLNFKSEEKREYVKGTPEIITKFISDDCVTVIVFNDSCAAFVGVAAKNPIDERDIFTGMKISTDRAFEASLRGFVKGSTDIFKEAHSIPRIEELKEEILLFMLEVTDCPFYNTYF